MIIYKATNKKNGKIYIGKTADLEHRINLHRKDSTSPKTRFHAAIKHYGVDGFVWEILAECEDFESDDLERRYIAECKSTDENIGYNLTFGGGGGDVWTLNPHKEETSRKLSDSIGNSEKHKKSHNTEEYIRRITEINRRKAKDPEFCRKLSEALKGRRFTEEHIQNMSAASKGKVLSKKHRENIRKAVKERMSDPENRKRISESLKGRVSPMKGRKHSKEAKEKMRLSHLKRNGD
jgi:group I intron endonuclease